MLFNGFFHVAILGRNNPSQVTRRRRRQRHPPSPSTTTKNQNKSDFVFGFCFAKILIHSTEYKTSKKREEYISKGKEGMICIVYD
jgi:hypothetical protein